MKRSRRQFLELLAAGSAAAIVAPAAALAQTATPSRRRRAPSAPATQHAPAVGPAALQAEVAKQKRDLTAALKTLRDYKLPDGSPAAFVFKPLRAARRSGS
jgi:hypothetical protein